MNWKLIVVGGLAFYTAAFIVSFASGAQGCSLRVKTYSLAVPG